MAQRVKNLPAMQETHVQSLGWEDPLGKGMATHSSIIAWRTPWTEEPGGLQSTGSQRVGYDLAIKQQQQHTEYTKNFQNSAVRKHIPTHQKERLTKRFEEPLYQRYVDGK